MQSHDKVAPKEKQIVSDQTESTARGFAAMDKTTHREVASRGGKSAHAKGTAHEFTPAEAREAGRLGGQKKRKRREHHTGEDRS